MLGARGHRALLEHSPDVQFKTPCLFELGLIGLFMGAQAL